MKEATETFVDGNGTIQKGERFAETHGVVKRNEDKFSDVADADVVTVIDGTDNTPVSQPSPTPEQAAAAADAGNVPEEAVPADTDAGTTTTAKHSA